MLLFTGGLQHPIPAALGGALWIASRVVYSLGYYTGSMEYYFFSPKFFFHVLIALHYEHIF